MNTEPSPTTLVAVRSPAMPRARSRLIARPSPVPSCGRVRSARTCTNGSNTASSLSAGMPMPVPQLPTVDRTVLRMALWELLVERDVPVKAVINEAVELAKRFGGANSGRFVNGVLGTVVAEHRPDARASDAAGPGDANAAPDANDANAADGATPGAEAPEPGPG